MKTNATFKYACANEYVIKEQIFIKIFFKKSLGGGNTSFNPRIQLLGINK